MTLSRLIILLLLVLTISSCGTSKKKSSRASTKPKSGKLSNKAILEKYSAKMGGRVDNVVLYSFIDQWVGVPYKFGGKSRSGIDCSNFTCEILRTVFSFPSNFYFPSSNLAEQGTKIESQDAKEGDLVCFAINQGSKISHVGIYLMNKKFVHASTSKGVIISSLDEDYYRSRFAFIRRIR